MHRCDHVEQGLRVRERPAQQVVGGDGCSKGLHVVAELADPTPVILGGVEVVALVARVALRAGAEAGRRFAEALALFANTASLGSTESLIVPPQMMGGKDLSPQEREWSDIRDGSIRLSIGIEDPADLLADLEQALLKA